MIAPYFQRYSEEITNVAFCKLDVDEVPDVASELGIRSMPTFLFFEKGERVSEFIGANWRALEVCSEPSNPVPLSLCNGTDNL